MRTVTAGYSTERWEKHTLDDPRAITLDLRHRRGTGSLGDLDRAHLHDDPDVVRFHFTELTRSVFV